jgi:hypothetical protein
MKNVLIENENCSIIHEDGKIYFADNQERVEIKHEPKAIFWDENRGYYLQNGKPLATIIV